MSERAACVAACVSRDVSFVSIVFCFAVATFFFLLFGLAFCFRFSFGRFVVEFLLLFGYVFSFIFLFLESTSEDVGRNLVTVSG